MLGDEPLDVFFGDAATKSGAGNLRQVDVVLLGDLAYQRAGANASLLAGLGYFALLFALETLLLIFRQVGGNRLFAGRRLRSLGLRGLRSALGRRLGRGCSGCGVAISRNYADDGIHLYGIAGLDFDLLQRARGWGGDFGVNFVGRDFKQRLVALHLLARLLQPLGDGSFKDRLAHLGHDYICRHDFLPEI